MFLLLALAGASVLQAQASRPVIVATFKDEGARAVEKELRLLANRALAHLTTVFSGPPRGNEGKPLDSLRLEISSATVGGGESYPGRIELLVGARPAFGFYDWRLALLHEIVHQWNSQSFRHADDREQWFNEGTAEFYALQAAGKLGVLDPARTVGTAATLVGLYTSARDLGSLSLRGAGVTPRLKADHYFLVYCGGFSAALVLDYDVRSRTGNSRSLDDLMRWLYTRHDRDEHPYAEPDLLAGLKAAAGFDYDEFFFRHIDGHSTLPVSVLGLGELARALGVRAAGETRGLAPDSVLARSLGIERSLRN